MYACVCVYIFIAPTYMKGSLCFRQIQISGAAACPSGFQLQEGKQILN